MKNFKKVLSLVLALSLLVSTMTISFAAADTTEQKAVILNALGLLEGVSTETFDPALDVQGDRQTAMVLLARAFGWVLDEEAVSEFEDVADWAQAAVAYAAENGVTNGVSEDSFGAKMPVTERMISTWIVRLLTGQELEASWEATADMDNVEATDRGDLVDAIWMALLSTPVGSDKTLIETLVEGDATKLAIAQEAGLVELSLSIVEVKAVKANVLEVTFSKAVDTEDVQLAVTRGTTAVAATAVWNADKTVATITTTANMISGTHTVTATSKADATMKITGETLVMAQKVTEIKILSDVALTGSSVVGTHDAKRAFVYYDVLDQYGQSLRTTTNLQWSFSAEKVSENKSTGMITLKRSDNNAFTFNEQIYISAVDTKTGVAVTKTVTIGQKQALNSIELAGYLKKGTTTIVKELPAGFQDATYYMLYTTKDQNGNAFVTDTPIANNEITLIADNALLISKIKDGETKVNIDGVEYNAVFVSPGINVDKGGEVNITAIANNTGNKVVINTVIGAYQILTTFNMSAPAVILADGETVEIPFEALDQDGKKITNFTTIARNATFNKLTFNTTFGTLKLAENADGTAKLTYADVAQAWNLATTTDGQDRVVSLTSIVVGGNTSSQMVSIQDKARPVGISSVTMDAATVEGGTIALNLSDTSANSFTFVDQYGRTMTRAAAAGFFSASPASFATHNSEFAGYTFAVRVTYKGDANVFTNGGNVVNNQEFEIANGTTTTFTAGNFVTVSAKSGMAFDFEVVKHTVKGTDGVLGNADDGFASAQAVSPKVTKSSTVVDITAVKGYAIKDIDKLFVRTSKSTDTTGSVVLPTSSGPALTAATITNGVTGVTIPASHVRKVEVTGLYNGITVKIPTAYISLATNKMVTVSDSITGVVDNAFKWSDFYDATTAQFTRKDATDTVKATITQVYVTTGAAVVVDSVSKGLTVSDAEPKATTITGKETFTVAPMNTVLVTSDLATAGDYKVKDQYNVAFTSTITYRVTTIVESAEGYATNNFKVTGNDSASVSVSGAERLDTFDLVVRAGDAIFTSKVTVGSDVNANISNGNNNYLDLLINNALEAQRQAGLN